MRHTGACYRDATGSMSRKQPSIAVATNCAPAGTAKAMHTGPSRAAPAFPIELEQPARQVRA